MADYEDYSDDDDYAATQEAAAQAALKAPVTYQLPYGVLSDYIKKEIIDLNAAYQRDVVWNAAKQGHLIDSLVKNYYVPPVIFSIRYDTRPSHRNQEIRVAIDGKQRLTSIHKFIEGEIPQIDSVTATKIWFKKPKGKKGSVLTAAERHSFETKLLTCVEYRGLNEEQEQEIFRRVQLGVALTTAEKMFARPGPVADFVRKLMEQYKDLCSLVESKRKLAFQILMTIFCVVTEMPSKIPSAMYLDKVLKRSEPVPSKHKALVESVLQVFATLMDQAPDLFRTPARMAPIEFIMSTYLIATKDEHTILELRDDIALMREKTRKKFLDIRSNQRVYDYMKTLIDKL
ncbi:uncharacterized protein SPPG_06150 [Spizellomyces punctatus DAOM BR117]|uniref:GmrSD restriction endonucleases N-terminal domain-containing protein n=1 Tax=Spizellomyces punctatus (strain DAOM BR117) TaxID=645134 RepID=A0A0L0HBY2_SPIPD|nr:uncharacterized protein SPPG_06150 [Spizellomyces punctatus DAOM BR117]KNC98446.1 hypothetical protein SPPG_06150 [Spizellomyces punctatus DAOM BR117]|eukprot:XP_016606486.1 hypothetical protein SPPG_06150 [Spizellomyces punctatus DAOM BR117]